MYLLFSLTTNTWNLFQDKNGCFYVETIQDDLRHLIATLKGPEGTPYEGGTFQVLIDVPEDYPLLPPKVSDNIMCKYFKLSHQKTEFYIFPVSYVSYC